MSLVLYANNEKSSNSSILSIKNQRAFEQVQTFFSLSANFLSPTLSSAALSTLQTLETLSAYSTPLESIGTDLTNPILSAARLTSIQTYFSTLTAPTTEQFLFYRKKISEPYNITLTLTETNTILPTDEKTVSAVATDNVAYYMVNGGELTQMSNLSPVTIACDTNFNSLVPLVCTFSVFVSALNKSAVPAQVFDFTHSYNTLSATALFFEDWKYDDVYAFYWNLSTYSFSGTEIPLNDNVYDIALLSALYPSEPNAEGILNDEVVVSEQVTSLLSTVAAITGKRINLFQLPLVSSAADMVYWVERRLKRFTHLELVSSGNTLKVIQAEFPTEDNTMYPVSALGGVSYSYTHPPLSGDGTRFLLSAVFLNEIPTVDFIAYPSFVLSNTNPVTAVDVTKDNFQTVVKNLAFIGEGHSQQFHLSGTLYNSSNSPNKQILWYIGSNDIQRVSQFSINTVFVDPTGTNTYEASTFVNSLPGVETNYSIAAFGIDPHNYITPDSPIITYPDNVDGVAPDPQYYPFYYSTTDATGKIDFTSSPLKSPILALKYPAPIKTEIKNPFSSNKFKLPYDETTEQFIATKTSNETITSIFTETEIQTNWELKALANNETSWSINAVTDPIIQNYIFDLSYDEEQNINYLPLFKAVKYTDTNITLSISATKEMHLDLRGYPIYTFRFAYTPTKLNECALAFGDITANKVYMLYWGDAGTVSSRVTALSSTISIAYDYTLYNLGTATNTTEMVTSVYSVLSGLTSLNVQMSGNLVRVEQQTLVPDLFLPVGLHRVAAKKEELPPNKRDWLPRRTTQSFEFNTLVTPHPLTLKLYTPNYYNLKETQVPFTIHFEEHGNYKLSAVDVSSTLAISSVRFYPIQKDKNETLFKTDTKNIFFNKIGLADFKLVAYVYDTTDPNLEVFTFERPQDDAVEIVERYDVVEPESYYTFLAPPPFSETEAPLLSPNEWLVADNVNDSLKRVYKTFEELNNLTVLYTNKNKLFSWISFQQTPSDPLVVIKKYTWQDLECVTNVDIEDQTVWFNFECENPNDEVQKKGIIWEDHVCRIESDPNCRQRHCLNWKWKSRKATKSPTKVTWKTAKRGNVFEKRWRFEPCNTDSLAVNCNKIRWSCINFDKKAFPIPYSNTESECGFVDIDYIESLDSFIIAHQKEVRLFKNNLEAVYLSRRGSADELFAFQDIVGIAINSEGRIYVLDRILPKVSVIQFADNELSTYDSWGNYGLKDNLTGFNKPSDIHIDQDNFVWIADTGNKCVKKFTGAGRAVLTIENEVFNENPPTSLCVDSEYNLHVLSKQKVFVFDKTKKLIFTYNIDSGIQNVTKINTNYNREMIYVTYDKGVAKYFKDGDFFGYLIKDYVCGDEQILKGYNNIVQDRFRNTFVVCTNKILKIGDLMKTVELKGTIPDNKYWKLQEILIDKEEYVQPWVYLKGFHRLWDNIEIIRSALFYNINKCKVYVGPKHKKEDLVIGQNELVTNTVLNRLIKQLWDNTETLKKYFDVECEKKLV
jgi:hypothetical protein